MMSAKKNRILVVGADNLTRTMIEGVLGERYSIFTAETGEDALVVVEIERPDAIILDMEIPDTDGFESCRRIKEIEAAIPVVFISALDSNEERLKGYEVGGADYITKPFYPPELEAKVAFLLWMASERASLKEMASYATSTAMTAMTSMGEMGSLLESLKNFGSCADYKSLVVTMLNGLSQYGLNGAAQIRSKEGAITINHHGEATPLEISVIGQMAKMGRIMQFKSRMSIAYPHVSLIVNDMPVEDADRCGRLRDHLAMLVEGAEARFQGIEAAIESQKRGKAIELVASRISEALNDIDSHQRQSRTETMLAFAALNDDVEKALLRLALTQSQDEYLSAIIREGTERIMEAQYAETNIQNKLTAIISELKEVSGARDMRHPPEKALQPSSVPINQAYNI